MMNEQTLLRHARHLALPELGYSGQKALMQKKVLLIGLGGLGSLVSQYLVGAGVGSLFLVDRDVVEISNLARQILYTSHDIGKRKADMAKERLSALNPDIFLKTLHEPSLQELQLLLNDVDLIIDGTDNFESRYVINEWCLKEKKPLLSASALGHKGQVILFLNEDDAPCYACLYPNNGEPTSKRCAENGVVSTVVAQVASMQAHFALMFLADKKIPANELFVFDGLQFNWRKIQVKKDSLCQVCGDFPPKK